MAKPWIEVEQSEAYQSLDPASQIAAKQEYWNTVVTAKDGYNNLPPQEQLAAKTEFMGNISTSRQGVDPSMMMTRSGLKFRDPLGAQIYKDKTAVEKTVSSTDMFLSQFGRSYNELKTNYPEIGEVGFTGWATRKGASIDNALDGLPETKAFQVELQPLANGMAREIEGGRVTDNDRKIYADAFANTLKHPSQTNIRLASNSLINLKNKGGDVTNILSKLYASDVDLFPKIAAEVLKDDPKLRKQIMMEVYKNNPDRFEVVE
jgi:hypothetical protein